jgi:hypothetical protein
MTKRGNVGAIGSVQNCRLLVGTRGQHVSQGFCRSSWYTRMPVRRTVDTFTPYPL